MQIQGERDLVALAVVALLNPREELSDVVKALAEVRDTVEESAIDSAKEQLLDDVSYGLDFKKPAYQEAERPGEQVTPKGEKKPYFTPKVIGYDHEKYEQKPEKPTKSAQISYHDQEKIIVNARLKDSSLPAVNDMDLDTLELHNMSKSLYSAEIRMRYTMCLK